MGPLLVLLAALGWSPALGAAQQEGLIRGNLVNRTPAGASVANAEVTLKTYVGNQERGQTAARSDGQGRFQFTGLSTASNYSYGLTIVYQEAEYDLGPRRFEQGANILDWEVSVYDATPNPEQVRVGRGHLVLDVRENALVVLQFFSFLNTGDKTFVGSKLITAEGRKETLRFSLPKGATQVTPNEGLMECCIVKTEAGLSDTMAVAPGGRDIVFSYQLPNLSSRLSLDLPLYYPVDNLNLLVSNPQVGVSSPQLQSQGLVDTGGQKYLHYAGRDLFPDTRLSLELSGLPQGAFLTTHLNTNTLRWGGVLLALAAVGFALVYPLRRRQAARAGSTPALRLDRREVLLMELAELDDRFEDGEIEADEYQRVRGEKKRRLMELMAGHEADQA